MSEDEFIKLILVALLGGKQMKVEMTLEVINGIKNGHEKAMQSCKSAEEKLLISIAEQNAILMDIASSLAIIADNTMMKGGVE